MKVGDYKQNKVKEIIEDAMSQLMAVGASNDAAASLLVVQGMLRVESLEKRKELAATVASFAGDDDEN